MLLLTNIPCNPSYPYNPYSPNTPNNPHKSKNHNNDISLINHNASYFPLALLTE